MIWDNWFKKPGKKRVLIAIHGFGRRKQEDFNYLKAAVAQVPDLEYCCFDLYDEAREDSQWHLWVARANKAVTAYIEKGYEVTLLGFSMGGVIATFLASFLPVSKLILVAPAFEYMSLENVSRIIPKYAAILKKSESEFKAYIDDRMLEYEYFPQFMELVRKLKPSVKKVSCPVLFLHGLQDEFVPLSSSQNAYHQMKSTRKQLICFESCGHELLESRQNRQDAFMLIVAFINDQWGSLKEPEETEDK